MASSSEQPEYSSPAKRRKVDFHDIKTSPGTQLDFRNGKLSDCSTDRELEETMGGDSGFVELSDGSKLTSNTSECTNSSTPTRADSTSDDTGCPLDTADEKDEISSTVSNLSDLSGLSELSGKGEVNIHWRSASSWIQKQMLIGADPRDLLHHLIIDSNQIPEEVDEFTLWKIIVNMMPEPPRRQKLRHINTLNDVVRLIRNCKNIIVLTGAGVSVSCGIPDFRSRDGIYSRLAQDFPNLPDPQAMFDINYFSQDPRPFFKFAREIYPGQFKPSPCHRFIKVLDKQKKLLRNYSQNIDTLEQVAGINNVIECHGSFATASCTRCKYQVKADDIREDIFAQKIPLCPKCKANALPSIGEINPNENYKELVSLVGIMKPDIVFFGEGLPDAFHEAMAKDKDECDLLIVIGSSLKVRPVALIPSSIPPHVPQILINRESLPHLKFDVELLGDGDVIINQLCHLMEEDCYKEVCWRDTILKETAQLLPSQQLSSDDSWEQSQEESNNDMSQDSVEVRIKKTGNNHVSTENQDGLTMELDGCDNRMKRATENTEICISPFHAGHIENTEGSFTLFTADSPKRRLSDSSAENSPKRVHLSNKSIQRKKNIKHDFDDRLALEECHVVPKTELPISSTKTEFSYEKDEGEKENEEKEKEEEKEDEVDDDEDETEEEILKSEKKGITGDYALDSGLGESCNSTDSAVRKCETTVVKPEEQDKIHQLDERHCWQHKARESLSARLPENSYYQLMSGKYIFPGAEVYTNVDEFDRCSISANSESTDSDTDSSSDEEEETCPDDDLSEGVDGESEKTIGWTNSISLNEIQR